MDEDGPAAGEDVRREASRCSRRRGAADGAWRRRRVAARARSGRRSCPAPRRGRRRRRCGRAADRRCPPGAAPARHGGRAGRASPRRETRARLAAGPVRSRRRARAPRTRGRPSPRSCRVRRRLRARSEARCRRRARRTRSRCSSSSAMSRYAATGDRIVRCSALMHYRVRQMLVIALAVLAGCGGDDGGSASPERAPVILATTTSTRDSGLLDVLVPAFERETGYPVKTIAVGSGEAIEMGKRGEADVVLAHSPGRRGRVDGRRQGRGAADRDAQRLRRGRPRRGSGRGEGRERGGGALPDRRGAVTVHLSRRRVGHAHVRAATVEGRRSDARGRVVSGVRPGHGCDAADRQRQGGVHDQRSRHVPRHQERARPRDPRGGRRRRCSTSIT